jgi:hypothetical protein
MLTYLARVYMLIRLIFFNKDASILHVKLFSYV